MVSLATIIDPSYADSEVRHFEPEQVFNFELEKTIDERVFLPQLAKGLKKGSIKIDNVEVSSTDRAVGTILGSEITEKFGTDLADDSVIVELTGGGGQSFGAFIPKGLTIKLTGDANDGFGKGLSGGKLIIKPYENSGFEASNNVIIGNVALYGATNGTAYVCGVAGERFMIRNSGATGVCEGVGDHGLEYMTGGRAVILGEVGKNFAAGMSGGIAYILDEHHTLYTKINKALVEMSEVTEDADKNELKQILEDYEQATGSSKAKAILQDFDNKVSSFKKIIPTDYRHMLMLIAKYEEQGIQHEQAVYEAFKESTKVGA